MISSTLRFPQGSPPWYAPTKSEAPIKSEARNPKSETSPKFECRNVQNNSLNSFAAPLVCVIWISVVDESSHSDSRLPCVRAATLVGRDHIPSIRDAAPTHRPTQSTAPAPCGRAATLVGRDHIPSIRDAAPTHRPTQSTAPAPCGRAATGREKSLLYIQGARGAC